MWESRVRLRGDAEGARGGFAEPPPNLSGNRDHYATCLWTSEEMAFAIMYCFVVSFFILWVISEQL